jgi:hypothetical protein
MNFISKALATALLALFAVSTLSATTPPSSAKVYSNVQAMSGWTPCSACALGGGTANFTFKQNVSSPSLSGHAIAETIRGGDPYSHLLAYKNLGSTSSSIHHFIQDAYLRFDKPSNSNAFSIAGHQTVNGKHYRFSTQCSYNKGVWSVWDTKNRGWKSTGVACVRPPANTWQHIVIETERTSDGREHFISISVNGNKHYINKYVYPEGGSGSSTGMHLEIDGNKYEAPYTGYWDKVKFTVW